MYLPFPCSVTSPNTTWTNTIRIAKLTALKRGHVVHQENDTNWVMVALSLLCWSIYLCFRYFDRFRTLSCNFHPASSNFPPSIPLIFLNFPPSINPLLHALKTELFFPPRVCSSAAHLFVHFQKYLRTLKQYSSIQKRILAWTNSSCRALRHVWCWVEFHPHHCLRGDCVIGQERDLLWPDWKNWWVWPWVPAFEIQFFLTP